LAPATPAFPEILKVDAAALKEATAIEANVGPVPPEKVI
jgi:hypothetical protein